MKPTKTPAATVRFKEGGLLGKYPFTTIPQLLRHIWDDLLEFDYDFSVIYVDLPDGRQGEIPCLLMFDCFAEEFITDDQLAEQVFATGGEEATV